MSLYYVEYQMTRGCWVEVDDPNDERKVRQAVLDAESENNAERLDGPKVLKATPR